MSIVPHSRPWLLPSDFEVMTSDIREARLLGNESQDQFRALLEEKLCAQNVLLFPSGTAACWAALRAVCSIDGTGEMVIPTYLCPQVQDAGKLAGLEPRLVDSGSHWIAGPDKFERALSTQTRVLMPVSTFGLSVRIGDLRSFGIPIIYDCCQSLAELIEGKDQELGDMATLSFHATKYLTTGSGGAVVCFNDNYLPALRKLERQQSSFAPALSPMWSLGVAQLARLSEFRAKRAALLDTYREEVPVLNNQAIFQQPHRELFRLALRFDDISFRSAAAIGNEMGVAVRRGVDTLLHRGADLEDADFPNAFSAYQKTISVPFHPSLSVAESEKVVKYLKALLA